MKACQSVLAGLSGQQPLRALLAILGGALIAGPASAAEPSWKTLWVKDGNVQQVRVLLEWGNGRKIYESRQLTRPDHVDTVELDCGASKYRLLAGPLHDYVLKEKGLEKAREWAEAKFWKTQSLLCQGVSFRAYD